MSNSNIKNESGLIYKVDETGRSPYIFLDPGRSLIIIRGVSIPESAESFYSPVADYIEEYFRDKKFVKCEINLEYWNSSSSEYLKQVFSKIDLLYRNGTTVIFSWFYEDEDDDSFSLGKEIEYMNSFPVDFIMLGEEKQE